MRAILSLTLVCLLAAVWTLVILWSTGVLMVEEVREDSTSPAALPVALAAEEPPTAVDEDSRGLEDDPSLLEGPRVLDSTPAAEARGESIAPETVTSGGNAAKNITRKKPAAKKNRNRPNKPVAANSAAPAEAEPPSVEVVEATPKPEVVPCVCAGRVLTADGALPLAGHLVELDLGGEVMRATTDELGAFTMGVGTSAPERLVSARVREPAGDLVHFSELLPGADVELLVRSAARLGGRLETQPSANYASLEVAVILPGVEGLHSDLLLASAAVDAEGRFLLEGTEPFPTDEYRLRFHNGNATVAVAEVSRALMAEGEALIQIELARLELYVRDLTGSAIPGAQVRLVRFGDEGAVESATTGTILCDVKGLASAELQSGSWELCVSAPGYAPRALARELTSAQVTSRIETTLQRLVAEDLVRGEVLSADGKPVAGALVTARPPSRCRNLSEQVAARTRTDKRGRFELSLDLDALTVLEAEHPLHGRIEQAPVAPGFRAASLRFQPRYPLKVGVVLGEVGGKAPRGVVRYALFDSTGELCASGVSESPLDLQNLEQGEYELFAASATAGAGGRGTVQVTVPDRGTTARGAVRLDAWPATKGIVSDPEGAPLAGLIVVAEMGDWPAAIAFECGRAVTDEAGRFEFRVPIGEALKVRVMDGARVLSSGAVELGSEGVLTVR